MSRWEKAAFYRLARGFWAIRVANGLSTPAEADKRVEQQRGLIDEWYPPLIPGVDVFLGERWGAEDIAQTEAEGRLVEHMAEHGFYPEGESEKP